jgi:hypothetical protein
MEGQRLNAKSLMVFGQAKQAYEQELKSIYDDFLLAGGFNTHRRCRWAGPGARRRAVHRQAGCLWAGLVGFGTAIAVGQVGPVVDGLFVLFEMGPTRLGAGWTQAAEHLLRFAAQLQRVF